MYGACSEEIFFVEVGRGGASSEEVFFWRRKQETRPPACDNAACLELHLLNKTVPLDARAALLCCSSCRLATFWFMPLSTGEHV